MELDKEQNELLARLFREMHKPLYIYALSALGDGRFAEEAVQDTFRTACIKIDSLSSSKNKEGWLFITLKHTVSNIRRSQASLSRDLVASLSLAEDKLVRAESDAFFEIEYSDLIPAEDFQLLKMIVLNKYTILEAANELGISVEACKKRVQRVKKKLRKIIEENNLL